MTFSTSYRTFNCALYHIFKTRLNCFLQCDRNWKLKWYVKSEKVLNASR